MDYFEEVITMEFLIFNFSKCKRNLSATNQEKPRFWIKKFLKPTSTIMLSLNLQERQVPLSKTSSSWVLHPSHRHQVSRQEEGRTLPKNQTIHPVETNQPRRENWVHIQLEPTGWRCQKSSLQPHLNHHQDLAVTCGNLDRFFVDRFERTWRIRKISYSIGFELPRNSHQER